ncbi:hypothetical protein HK104_006830 [Borealophlyctis nickersoniae]|nr:hypothetical protein HK104_006830 [Borealophlyctis nickersoniae]
MASMKGFPGNRFAYPSVTAELAEMVAGPVVAGDVVQHDQAQATEVAAYNDEYSKLFNAFTPFEPPSQVQNSAQLLSHPSFPPSPYAHEDSFVSHAVAAQRVHDGLPSSLIAPSSPRLENPRDEVEEMMDRFFAGTGERWTMASEGGVMRDGIPMQLPGVDQNRRGQWPPENGDKAVEVDIDGRRTGEVAISEGPGNRAEGLYALWIPHEIYRGKRRRPINILKIRRRKMNNHKHKKRRKKLRNSKRYNKKRLKKKRLAKEDRNL